MDKLADIKFIETALELRRRGKTQREVGGILGVPQQTISDWENISNVHVDKTYIPDSRVIVPRKVWSKIYERAKKGESQAKIVADYKISQPRVSQIVRQEGAKGKEKSKIVLKNWWKR